MAASRPLKYLVVFFNFIFLVFGIILLGIGIWGEITNDRYGEVEIVKEYEVKSGPRLLIAVAVFVIIISFLGCCGAWKENQCMLCAFVIVLAILLILEIAAAALAYKHKDEFRSKLSEALKKKIDDYKPSNNSKSDVDDAQEKLKCCGVNSYKDWNSTIFNQGGEGNLPDSCCKHVHTACGVGKLKNPDGDVYTEGCVSKISNDFSKILSATGGISIAILVIQILGILFGLILFCQVRNNQDTKEIA